ncbi:CLUMA_CG001664, isoform A [Clunio marinus]|uniref:CLUMA_CG001664, isoform A n=1 Tax=Clunio marinus TaxID=568069 RepID=A0A1J1HIN9_9DIPT|nr:CLUMA_CG001664, isoform A [Clunio marinus]
MNKTATLQAGTRDREGSERSKAKNRLKFDTVAYKRNARLSVYSHAARCSLLRKANKMCSALKSKKKYLATV